MSTNDGIKPIEHIKKCIYWAHHYCDLTMEPNPPFGDMFSHSSKIYQLCYIVKLKRLAKFKLYRYLRPTMAMVINEV